MYKNQEAELDRLLSYVLKVNASDLHLVVGKPPTIRIDGVLSAIPNEDALDGEKIESLVTVMMGDTQKAILKELCK